MLWMKTSQYTLSNLMKASNQAWKPLMTAKMRWVLRNYAVFPMELQRNWKPLGAVVELEVTWPYGLVVIVHVFFSLPVAIRDQLPQYRSIVLPIFSVCEMINWLLDCGHLLRRWHFTQMAVLHSGCEKRTYCCSFTDPKIWSQNLSDSRYNDFVTAISKCF